jgi:aminomethyltransferase
VSRKDELMKNVYTGTAEEYRALRGSSGLVDYEGVGLIRVSGPNAAALLGDVSSRNVDFLLEGQISAALVLDDDGAILGEVLIYCRGTDYLVEIWPSQAERTRAHILAAAARFDGAEAEDDSGAFRVFGIEGPASPKIAAAFLPFPISSMAYRSFVSTDWDGGVPLLLSRTGVSGEYGYKFHVPHEAGDALRARLVEAGATEVGVGALDVCRMEMRFPNLERESAGEQVTPFDLGLQWMVDFQHDFTGKDSLLERWKEGPAQLPVCFVAAEGLDTPPGAGTPLSIGDTEIGKVAHAVYSPTLGRVIGTARVEPTVASSGLDYALGGEEHPVSTVSAPFMVATSFGVPLE